MGPVAALALSLIFSPAPAIRPLPTTLPPHVVVTSAPAPPTIDGASWALRDVAGDTELVAVNGDLRRAMASVTKVMTALLVSENSEPDESVRISETAAATPIGYVGQPEVLAGEVWTVEELLDNLLVQSGNDAAVALAEHVSGSEAAFVELMNERAQELGMENTSYVNPNGLDRSGHAQSARDLITLGMAVVDDELIMRTARLKGVTFTPNGRVVRITNTNRLIGSFPGLLGIKTGETAQARKVLLALADLGDRRLLSVVMGSSDHFAATAELVAWGRRTLGVRDHLLAGLRGTADEALLEPLEAARLGAITPLADGRDRLGGATPAERAVVDTLADLLPAVLGGSG